MNFMDDVVEVEIEQTKPVDMVHFRLGDDGVFREIPEDEYKAISELADKVESFKTVDGRMEFIETLSLDQLKDLMRETFYRDLYRRMV